MNYLDRKIIHIDMDAFYASIEQRDFPELKGKAIAVGGGSQRGVVATASYEARKYGVHSAMSGFQAQKLCPHIIFVKARFDIYKRDSQKIREIFSRYSEIIEPLSLDEAYIDVTENKINEPYATTIAESIMNDVSKETGLTCSAGVSYCKFLAKIASDINKPNGMTVIKPAEATAFLEKLPVRKFHGVGKVTALKMESLGIFKGSDLKKLSKFQMAQYFGKTGRFYYDIVRGIDKRPVKNDRIRKSLAVERTFSEDVSTVEDIKKHLDPILDNFYNRLSKIDNFGRTLTLKIKTSDFQIITRSETRNYYIRKFDEIKRIIMDLLLNNLHEFDRIRLIGVTMSNLEKEQFRADSGIQLKLEFNEG